MYFSLDCQANNIQKSQNYYSAKIDMHYFSDNIVLARYIRLKTLPMDILNKFKQFKTELIFFLL